MITITPEALAQQELGYPGISAEIQKFEAADLPACKHCCSQNTAQVQYGLVGRSLAIASATTKFKLMPNRSTSARFFCNACAQFFG